MAYTAATQMPDLNYFQWSRPDAENPRLASPISSTATTIVVTNAALDKDGSAITGDFLMGCKDSDGFTELIYIPTASSTDGLTFTSCVRGIRPQGLDYTTGDTSFAVAHESGDPVFCSIAAVNFDMMISALQGDIGSGGTSWKIGDGTASDIDFTFYNDQTVKPKFYLDDSAYSIGTLNRGDDATQGDEPFATLRLNTAQKATYLSSLINGQPVYDTTAGVMNWVEGGAYVTNQAGGSVADASETVAGKVELATTTEFDAGTDTGATGAKLVAVPSMFGATTAEITQLSGTTNIAEADTFFSLTDATGSEMEALTDGSDASGLHTHSIKTGTFTWNPANAAATSVITHNLGFVPQLIRIKCTPTNAGYNDGTYDGTNYALTYYTNSNTYNESTSLIINIYNAGTHKWDATITDNSANSFTLDVGTHTGAQSEVFFYEVFA